MISLSDLEKMEQVLQLPLNVARRDYHWKHEGAFDKEFGLGMMAYNVPKLKELVRLAKLGRELESYMKTILDCATEHGYNGTSIGQDYVNILRQRTTQRDASEGGPDEGVSETLRELPLSSVYREAIARPERTWSGFARVDHLRTQDEISRAGSKQNSHAGRHPETQTSMDYWKVEIRKHQRP